MERIFVFPLVLGYRKTQQGKENKRLFFRLKIMGTSIIHIKNLRMWSIFLMFVLVLHTQEQCRYKLYNSSDIGCIWCPNSLDDCDFCKQWLGYEISGDICCDTKVGQYADGSGGCTASNSLCLEQNCLSCSSPDVCEVCDTENYSYLSGSSCCDTTANYFPDGHAGCGECDSIHPGCFFCIFDLIINETVCGACDTTKGFQMSGVTCCDTKFGSFPDGNGGCTPPTNPTSSCDSPGCLSCPISSVCGICDVASGFYVSGDVCCDTVDGYFPDGSVGCAHCGAIISGCSHCIVDVIHGGITECIACDSPQYVSSGQVCCNTANNVFPDADGGCEACEAFIMGCLSCTYDLESSVIGCEACAAGYSLSGSMCCEDGVTVPDGSGGCAPACPMVGCLTCISPYGCVICYGGFTPSSNICCDDTVAISDGIGGCIPI